MTGDRFPLPVNTGRVDGRAFPLAELTGRVDGPSTRLVETEINHYGKSHYNGNVLQLGNTRYSLKSASLRSCCLSSANIGSTTALSTSSDVISSTSWRGFPATNNSIQSRISLAGTSLNHTKPMPVITSDVTKAVHPESEAKAPPFDAEAEAVAFETEAKIQDAVHPKTEAARQYVNKSHT